MVGKETGNSCIVVISAIIEVTSNHLRNIAEETMIYTSL